MLRDIARTFGAGKSVNVLVFDERGEIAAMDGYGDGFDLGNGLTKYSNGILLSICLSVMCEDAIMQIPQSAAYSAAFMSSAP